MLRKSAQFHIVQDPLSLLQTSLKGAETCNDSLFDSVVYVSDVRLNSVHHEKLPFYAELSAAVEKDVSFYNQISVFYSFAKLVVFAPINLPICEYSNEISVYVEAIRKAFSRVCKAGCKNPFFIFELADVDSKLLSIILGICQEMYISLELYECLQKSPKETSSQTIVFSVVSAVKPELIADIVNRACVIENGRIITRGNLLLLFLLSFQISVEVILNACRLPDAQNI